MRMDDRMKRALGDGVAADLPTSLATRRYLVSANVCEGVADLPEDVTEPGRRSHDDLLRWVDDGGADGDAGGAPAHVIRTSGCGDRPPSPLAVRVFLHPLLPADPALPQVLEQAHRANAPLTIADRRARAPVRA
jgi:hypothetical protein